MPTSATPAPQPRKARRLSKARAALARAAAYLFPAAALFLSAAAPGPAQTFAQMPAQKEAPAAVSGRVTDGERGVAGVAVVLTSSDPSTRPQAVARAKTDAEGNYRLTNVPPGRYKILPFAPTHVVQGMSRYDYPPGKPLNLAAGESVEDIDFRLERGGVITGRVTDAEGNPVIGEVVSIFPVDKNQQSPMLRGPIDPRDYSTDDRGVYRIYGLLPGRYHVSVGQGGEGGAVSFGRRRLYRRTFYPEATEESQAKVVEVTAGGEATDVDITLGRAVKTYRASGRFVNAETGQPVANVPYSYGPVTPDGRFGGSYGGGYTTNERGEFQTEGLAPGHYAVFAGSYDIRDNSEFYNEPATFDVVDADVTGVVVKLRTGASVSGVVTLEGVSDQATAARLLSGVRLYGIIESAAQRMEPSTTRMPAVTADGSFRFAGLRPGKLRISASTPPGSGLTLWRVELNGANASGGVDVAEGAQVTGVRVVLVRGSGAIRGQVNVTNGAVPPGARLYVNARRAGSGAAESAYSRSAEADARGRFAIENLPPGEYEVRANIIVFQPGMRPPPGESQHVALGEGGDMSVTLTVDLSAPVKGGRP